MARKRFLLIAGLSILLTGCANGVRTPLGDIVWTRYQSEKQLSREAAAARANYCPTSGCIIRLESVEVTPSQVRRGGTLTTVATYTLLTAEEVSIPVTISRELYFGGKSLGRVRDTLTTNLNGTWTEKVDFPLPADAQPGLYTLVTRISTGYGSDQRGREFTVQ